MKQHVTVVPSDRLVIVDGEALRFDFKAPEGVHAIQWHDGSGHVEWTGKNNTDLEEADYEAQVASFVTLWEAEKARLETKAAEAEAEYNSPENVHIREVSAAQTQARGILTARAQAAMLQTEDFTSEEFSLFAAAELYPVWAAGAAYTAGQRIQHSGIVYQVMQNVTALEHQAPDAEGMLAVYSPLSSSAETDADGSQEHPYTFIYGMSVEAGLYYTYEEKLYLAKANMNPCVWYPGSSGAWQWEAIE